MTTESETRSSNQFVVTILPWVIGAGALALYLATLNHGVSFNNLAAVAKVSGWTWQGEYTGPVTWLLTYPLRWLPAASVPLGINVFSALCAALSLVLLARTVALLPYNRTQEQRLTELNPLALLSTTGAWVPPLLACLVLGLQLSFWESATSGAGQPPDLVSAPYANHSEMVDLLCLAYVIRCLLEFRVSERQGWLSQAAFGYAVGMVNNWAMVGFFPLFVLALVRLQGLKFWHTRFLGRMLLWGLLGLAVCLLLPAVTTLGGVSHTSFWLALKYNFLVQKSHLAQIHTLLASAKQMVLLFSLASVVPVCLISIRWGTSFGDSSELGAGLTRFVFHLVHALFLAICLWMALDPSFSPRNKAFPTPCFSLALFGAISVGYLTGYFLLLARQRRPPRVRVTWSQRAFSIGSGALVVVALVAAPALLLLRNLPQIRVSSGPLLRDYADLQAKTLPREGGILLGDDPRRLAILRSFCVQNGTDRKYLFIDTHSLPVVDYHRYLRREYGPRWPVNPPRRTARQPEVVPDLLLMRLISTIALTNNVYYLQPSFGYYFETLELEPHGLVYKLVPCPTNSLMPRSLSREAGGETEAFWAAALAGPLKRVAAAIDPKGQGVLPTWLAGLLAQVRVNEAPNREARELGVYYSLALVHWGVQEQKRGELAKAAEYFRKAREFCPDNLVAQVNLECNQHLQAGQRPATPEDREVEGMLSRYRYDWNQLLAEKGPFDDPTYTGKQGDVFAHGQLYRQAAQCYARVAELAPDDFASRLSLAKMNLLRDLPEESLRVLEQIRRQAPSAGGRSNEVELLVVETAAYLARQQVAQAEAAIQTSLARFPTEKPRLDLAAARVYLSYGLVSNAISRVKSALTATPGDQETLMQAAQIFVSAGENTNALACVQAARAKAPKDVSLLAAESQVCLNAGWFSNAVVLLDQVLKAEPDNPQALVSKGYASLELGAFDQAIAALSQALEMERNNTPALRLYAHLNRAVAFLRSGKFDEARRDYEAVDKSSPGLYQVQYGLGEIAYQKKEAGTALQKYQRYLDFAPTNTDEYRLVSARVKELKPRPASR